MRGMCLPSRQMERVSRPCTISRHPTAITSTVTELILMPDSGKGTVFAVNTDGTEFTTLHTFSGGDGAFPDAGLILSGNTLYGAALFGGSLNYGTVFSI